MHHPPPCGAVSDRPTTSGINELLLSTGPFLCERWRKSLRPSPYYPPNPLPGRHYATKVLQTVALLPGNRALKTSRNACTLLAFRSAAK
eukprot:1726399-Amphidinium_carterae.1